MENQSSSQEPTNENSHRCLKICCAVSAIVIILITLVLIILYFTIFKPKEPTILIRSATLQQIRAEIWPAFFLNFTLGMGITINNKNYGGFKYENSTVYLNYQDIIVGESPIHSDTVQARKKHDFNLSATIFADKLLFGNMNFSRDFSNGLVNFTSSSTLKGKVNLFNNLIKKKATGFATCEISLHVLPLELESVCKSHVSF